jgi:pimeloyl-ACP methyl ester carboxylesterase
MIMATSIALAPRAAAGAAASGAALPSGSVRAGSVRAGSVPSGSVRARSVSAGSVSAGPGAPAARHPIRVGTVTIPPCKASALAWCTRIRVPYDYRNPAAGTIKIGFRWYPAARGKAAGTILAVEGGPGFATTGTAADYRAAFLPLLGRRNLLLINLRGTGNSSAFTCKALQDWTVADSNAAYTIDTGSCGRQLNHTRRLAGGGGYVQASDLYTTANAARDVALVLRRLRTGKVDLYGDSYGTFFSQVFTARYAGMLRSVTLDAAYPVSQRNPWYPQTIRTARRAFDASCRRGIACRSAAPGSSSARIARLAAYLRAHPVAGRTRKPSGRLITERVGVAQLIELVNNAGTDSIVYRELDPAARALLRHHDTAPLLRLAATDLFTGNSGPVREFNDGLYQATTCLDYPQPFSYRASAARRQAQYDAAASALPRRTFAPFTVSEWITEPEEEFDACLDWPGPAHPDPPITTPAPYAPRTLPVLVLSGDLDSLTTPVEGRQAARDMGPSARWILIHNDTHVNALQDAFGCADHLVRAFITAPSALRRLDASCAKRTPEVRVVGSFATRLADMTPAAAVAGNRAGRQALRLAAVAAAVTGDGQWRWYYGNGVTGWGLRGGTYAYSGGASVITIRLTRVKWATDTMVSGHARWDQASGQVRAALVVTGPGGRSARVYLSYRDYVYHSVATISGSYRGRPIRASMPAP